MAGKGAGPPASGPRPQESDGALGSRVVRSGSLAALSLFSKQIIAFGGFVVLARLAGPHTFGSYSAAAILVGWGALFTEAGMQAALVQRQDKLDEAASTGFLVNLAGGALLALAAVALAPVVGLFFHSFQIGLASAALAGTVPITAAGIVPGALLQRQLSIRRVLIEPLSSASFVFVSAITLGLGLGIWGLVLGTYASALTGLLAIWFLGVWRPRLRLFSWKMYKELTGFGRQVLAGEALRELGRVGNAAVVGRTLSIATLGEYRYALQLVIQSTLPVTFGSAYVLLPAFSQIWQDEQRFRAALFRSMRILSMIVFPISLSFLPLGKAFATVLFGQKWAGAGPIMMALSGVGIAYAIDSISSEVFKARGRPDLLPRMHGLTAVIPLVFLLPLTWAFGSTGAGLAMTIGTLVVAIYALRSVGRLCSIALGTLWRQVTPALIAASAMILVLFVIEHYLRAQQGGLSGLGRLCVELLVGGLVYLGALAVIARRSVLELFAVARTVVKRAALTPSADSTL